MPLRGLARIPRKSANQDPINYFRYGAEAKRRQVYKWRCPVTETQDVLTSGRLKFGSGDSAGAVPRGRGAIRTQNVALPPGVAT